MCVQYELAMSNPVELYYQKLSGHRLDPNHTRFIVVDDLRMSMTFDNDFRLQCECKPLFSVSEGSSYCL